jgi:hypothetical protein
MSAATVSAARDRALRAVSRARYAREALDEAMEALLALDEARDHILAVYRAGDAAAGAWVYQRQSGEECIDQSAARLDAMQRALFEALRRS